VSHIQAPEEVGASEVFDVIVSFSLPASFTYPSADPVNAGIEILIDTDLEQDPHSQIIVSLLEPPPEEPPEEPPSNPINDIIETITQTISPKKTPTGGGGGGGLPPAPTSPTTEQPQNQPESTGTSGDQTGTPNTPSTGTETSGEKQEPNEVRVQMPEIVQEMIGVSDMSFNYMLMAAGTFALLVGIILYLKFMP
jgi:hypothetical protein